MKKFCKTLPIFLILFWSVFASAEPIVSCRIKTVGSSDLDKVLFFLDGPNTPLHLPKGNPALIQNIVYVKLSTNTRSTYKIISDETLYSARGKFVNFNFHNGGLTIQFTNLKQPEKVQVLFSNPDTRKREKYDDCDFYFEEAGITAHN